MTDTMSAPTFVSVSEASTVLELTPRQVRRLLLAGILIGARGERGRQQAQVRADSLAAEAARRQALAAPASCTALVAPQSTLPGLRGDGPDLEALRGNGERWRVVEAEHREAILKEALSRAKRAGRGGRKAEFHLVAAKHGLAVESIYRYLRDYRRNGLAGLLPAARKGRYRKLDAEARALIKAAAISNPNCSAIDISLRTYEPCCAMRGIEPVHRGTVGRLVRREREANKAAMTAFAAPRLFEAKFVPKVQRRKSADGTTVLLDVQTIDLHCELPDGRVIRPKLFGAVDDGTQYFWGALAAVQSAENAALFVRHVFLSGLPIRIGVDWGKEWVARRVAGRNRRRKGAPTLEEAKFTFTPEQEQSIVEACGVEVMHMTARHPWGKGKIEVGLRVMTEFVKGLVGYCGNSPTTRPERLARDIKAGRVHLFEEVQKRLSDEIDRLNNTPRRGQTLSPAQLLAQANRPRPDPRVLDFLLLRRAEAKVTTFGIMLNGRYWWVPALAPYADQSCTVAWDDLNGEGVGTMWDGQSIAIKPAALAEWGTFGPANAEKREGRRLLMAHVNQVAEEQRQAGPLAVDNQDSHGQISRRKLRERAEAKALQRAISAHEQALKAPQEPDVPAPDWQDAVQAAKDVLGHVGNLGRARHFPATIQLCQEERDMEDTDPALLCLLGRAAEAVIAAAGKCGMAPPPFVPGLKALREEAERHAPLFAAERNWVARGWAEDVGLLPCRPMLAATPEPAQLPAHAEPADESPGSLFPRRVLDWPALTAALAESKAADLLPILYKAEAADAEPEADARDQALAEVAADLHSHSWAWAKKHAPAEVRKGLVALAVWSSGYWAKAGPLVRRVLKARAQGQESLAAVAAA